MGVARHADAEHVQNDKPKSDIGKHAVHLGDYLLALLAFGALLGLRARRNGCAVGRERPLAALAVSDDPGGDGRGSKDKQSDDHGAPRRGVTEEPARVSTDQVNQIA